MRFRKPVVVAVLSDGGVIRIYEFGNSEPVDTIYYDQDPDLSLLAAWYRRKTEWAMTDRGQQAEIQYI